LAKNLYFSVQQRNLPTAWEDTYMQGDGVMTVFLQMTGRSLLVLAGTGILVAGCGNIADKYERNVAGSPPTTSPEPPPSQQELGARIFSPSWGRTGLELELDGRGSTGGTPQQLTYLWTLRSAPQGSTATIADASLPVARLLPDLEGQYEIGLEVRRGTESDSASSITTVVGPVNFISRVQTGLVEWTDFDSNTVEIVTLDHEVDPSRSLFMMTVRAERINPRFARYTPTYEFIDNRTIQIRTGSTPNDPMYVAWTVVEFDPAAVIGVQRGTVDRGLGDSELTEIALARPVDPRRSLVVPNLHQTQSVHTYELPNAFTARLTDDGAAIRLQSIGRPDPGTTLSQWQVVEFAQDSGVDVQPLELLVRPSPEFQRFKFEPVSLRNTFVMGGGTRIVSANTTFPVRQAHLAYLIDPETIEIRKSVNGSNPAEYFIQLYVVSVAGAEVYPFGGVFPDGSAFPETQPSWNPIDRAAFDPVVMSGWNAFQFVWGNDDNTAHTDMIYTVELNAGADGVTVERGRIESGRRLRAYNGYVVAWPRN
jgi:hypothetical protein